MNLNIYLILLVVLLIFNLIFWILVIWFRIFFECGGGICGFRSRRTRSNGDSANTESGHRNEAFVDEEDPARTRQRPYNIEERMESPPSYEEALKCDAFGFRHPAVHVANNTTPERSIVQNQLSASERDPAPVTVVTAPTTITPQINSLQSTSSTSSGEHGARSRSSTPPSSGAPPHLSPIREEEYDDAMPVTVVIDCIGVQASRLMENCDTHVQLTNGDELKLHSKC